MMGGDLESLIVEVLGFRNLLSQLFWNVTVLYSGSPARCLVS
jgi:hypothetical protein